MPEKTITIRLAHDFTDEVYLVTDPDQLRRIVTDVTVKPTGAILYYLCCGAHGSWHYDFEISTTKSYDR